MKMIKKYQRPRGATTGDDMGSPTRLAAHKNLRKYMFISFFRYGKYPAGFTAGFPPEFHLDWTGFQLKIYVESSWKSRLNPAGSSVQI